MSIHENFSEGDFANSTQVRLPICFCLDTSGSMNAPTRSGRTRMDEVNAAFSAFINSIKAMPAVNSAADIAIISFGGKPAIEQKFTPISAMMTPRVEVRSRSLTPIGEAILVALKMSELRKAGDKSRGIRYYQPWLVVITDGEPEGKEAVAHMEEAIKQTNALESQNKLVVFNIGIGDENDAAALNLDTLRRLSVKRPAPINLQVENISSFFELLGMSSASVVAGNDEDDILYGKGSDLPQGEKLDFSEWKT